MTHITFRERFHIPKYNDLKDIRPGLVAFDQEKCSGCAQCAKICPCSAIVMKDKRPEMASPIEHPCMACSDCTAICPNDAITLVSGNVFSGYFKTIDRGEILGPRI